MIRVFKLLAVLSVFVLSGCALFSGVHKDQEPVDDYWPTVPFIPPSGPLHIPST